MGNKSVNYLNNNDVDSTVNAAYKMATGIQDVDTLTLKDIIDAGSTDGGALAGKKEQFTKALISLWARNFFTDTEADEKDDPYFVDSREWGAITQMISAQALKFRIHTLGKSSLQDLQQLALIPFIYLSLAQSFMENQILGSFLLL